ncbi:molybdopterin-guanine dinucleotide biosynthesis protein A [Natronospira proteinivora]|uniref:Molybdopterin-guanine dinucleotide biosynthesis protein A n=1 Tax=Natronospira proteinivora TaxID=1807133 RepID=A0ABT1GAK5_9GAMM|nr:molybdenum cofactor guanylyltransferase [Natronospira proteinivora]MCP1727283.1 molybdopterin-guanine dinucleotide biosynthesis protein A [Natronospira proteinivora]
MATVHGSRAMPSAATVNPMPDFAGLVLAGGASSRMGRDKAALPWRGRTLLDHAVQTLDAAGAAPVLVSGERPAYDYVPDQYPACGPLGGLASVLSQRPGLQGRILVVIPVDTPGLDRDAIHALVETIHGGAAAACFTHHPLPLAVRVDDTLQHHLETILNGEGKKAVHGLQDMIRFRVLPDGGWDLSNVNTPEEWQRFTEVAG